MRKSKIKLLISIGLGILSLNGLLFSTAQASDVEDVSDLLVFDRSETTCYSVVAPVYKDTDYQALRIEYHQVEKLYKDKKINEETYRTRIDKLKAQMNQKEQEYKQMYNKE